MLMIIFMQKLPDNLINDENIFHDAKKIELLLSNILAANLKIIIFLDTIFILFSKTLFHLELQIT